MKNIQNGSQEGRNSVDNSFIGRNAIEMNPKYVRANVELGMYLGYKKVRTKGTSKPNKLQHHGSGRA